MTQGELTPLAYLEHALRLHPVRDADEAAGLRRRFLGGTPATIHQQPQDREQIVQDLQDLRGGFWVLSDQQLEEALARFDNANSLDLKRWVAQLRKIASMRRVFAKLEADPAVSRRLLRGLRQIATESPQNTIPVRRQLIDLLGPRSTTKAARRIRQCHPEIYALETGFIDSLAVGVRGTRLRKALLITGAILAAGLGRFIFLAYSR